MGRHLSSLCAAVQAGNTCYTSLRSRRVDDAVRETDEGMSEGRATGTVPRWKKISVHVGKPLSFAETTNDRVGWESIAAATENAVQSLMT